MKVRAFLLVALLALGACASTQRTFTYPAGMSDADVTVGDQRFQIWFHGRDQTVLVLRGDRQPLGVLLAQNVTVYANDRTLGILWWGAAANAVLTPIGCYATEVTGADQMREIEYTCPQPVDVRTQVALHRNEWRNLHVPAPAELR